MRNQEKQREYQRQYRMNQPDKARASYQKWLEKNRDREARRLREKQVAQYGISLDQYEERYAAQQGQCAICGLSQEILQVDHCHASGQVRGLLCRDCNTALGRFADDAARVEAALGYLRHHAALRGQQEDGG